LNHLKIRREETKDEDLRDLFSQSGTVELVSIPVNKETGKARGFAFVDMSSPEECDKAIENFGGSSFNGRVIRVTKSLPKDEAKKQTFSKRGRFTVYFGLFFI
jgi:RNA recognition motif-containing protein